MGAYIISLDEYESIGAHWIVLYVHDNNVTYFDSFGVEHIPRELIKLIGSENITTIEYYNYRIHMIWFNNVQILLYWIYWFYVKWKRFIGAYKLIFS